MMKPPGWKLPAESRRDVDRVHRIRGNVAECFGPADGDSHSERAPMLSTQAVEDEYVVRPIRKGIILVRVWRHMKGLRKGKFASNPYRQKNRAKMGSKTAKAAS